MWGGLTQGKTLQQTGLRKGGLTRGKTLQRTLSSVRDE